MLIAASRHRRTLRLHQPAGHREIFPPISARSARSHLRSWHPASAARRLRRKGRQCLVAESDFADPWRRIPARRLRMRNPVQRPESTSASTIQWPVTRNPRPRDRMECGRQGSEADPSLRLTRVTRSARWPPVRRWHSKPNSDVGGERVLAISIACHIGRAISASGRCGRNWCNKGASDKPGNAGPDAIPPDSTGA